MGILLLTLLLAFSAFGQRYKASINTETPEGQALQQIGQEADEAKKLMLLEKFVETYPKSENLGYVYALAQPIYGKTNQPDKVIAAGEKLVAMDPDDLDASLQSLKASEAQKDPDLVKKWSDQTAQIAKKLMAAPQPKEADDVEDWKKKVDYAKQVNTYTEYALYAGALQASDPKKKIELIEQLQQRNPQSEYLAKALPYQFVAYRQAGDNAKAVAVAEKVLATDQSNEDMLLVVADSYTQKNRDPDKVLAYSAKMIEVMNSKQKPEGVNETDWEKRKQLISGLGHLMSGKTYYNQGKFAQADKELRAALPFLESNGGLKAETLFHLGMSNYKMEKIQEALKFYQQSAAIKSPYQAQAQKNVTVIRAQYRAVKQ
jgi:tetratricopeptide (TPR) repeat protein